MLPNTNGASEFVPILEGSARVGESQSFFHAKESDPQGTSHHCTGEADSSESGRTEPSQEDAQGQGQEESPDDPQALTRTVDEHALVFL